MKLSSFLKPGIGNGRYTVPNTKEEDNKMLLNILMLPVRFVGWVFAGLFGMVSGLVSFLFSLMGGAFYLMLGLGGIFLLGAAVRGFCRGWKRKK